MADLERHWSYLGHANKEDHLYCLGSPYTTGHFDEEDTECQRDAPISVIDSLNAPRLDHVSKHPNEHLDSS